MGTLVSSQALDPNSSNGNYFRRRHSPVSTALCPRLSRRYTLCTWCNTICCLSPPTSVAALSPRTVMPRLRSTCEARGRIHCTSWAASPAAHQTTVSLCLIGIRHTLEIQQHHQPEGHQKSLKLCCKIMTPLWVRAKNNRNWFNMP